MIGSGKLIVLAYPDTFVKPSDEWQCKLFPLVGLGTFKEIKAGHAAMVLIENKTGKANYYDFGRYVTPEGFGRVRSSKTDAELEIPFKAKFVGNGPLENLDQFLRWLEANPQKTHGAGRLVASVCEEISFKKAQNYILSLQNEENFPYKAFAKNGSNCARFVTETILASTQNKGIIKGLNHIKRFTPSPIGNVTIAASSDVFEVLNGVIVAYKGSVLKENLTNYFYRNKFEKLEEKELPLLPDTAQKLSGTGSNSWFKIEFVDNEDNQYKITRYNDLHEVDYVGLFETKDNFDILSEFKITYDSHCEFCHVIQNEQKIKFNKVETCPEFIELQKVLSA
ncbi:MAG: hypothetical protein L3J09_08440 [Flavobacteriaceae bacterium]|nr:hypothetical protein [Flavobacteriaceae bacterium]